MFSGGSGFAAVHISAPITAYTAGAAVAGSSSLAVVRASK